MGDDVCLFTWLVPKGKSISGCMNTHYNRSAWLLVAHLQSFTSIWEKKNKSTLRLWSHRNIRYSLYAIWFALRHRRDSVPSSLPLATSLDCHLWRRANRITYNEYRIPYTSMWSQPYRIPFVEEISWSRSETRDCSSLWITNIVQRTFCSHFQLRAAWKNVKSNHDNY